MYKLNLTKWDRLQANLCLPRNGPLGDVEQLLRIMDATALTEGEKDSVGYTDLPVQTQGGMVTLPVWEPAKMDKDTEEIEVSLKGVDFEKLKKLANQRQNWPTTDLRTLTFKRKIDAAVED